MLGSVYNSLQKDRFVILLVVIYLLTITLTGVTSIKCYQCKEPDVRCRDPFQNDTAFFKPCPPDATKCRKYKWEIGDGRTYFERGCAVHGEVSRREGRNCITRVGTFKTRMSYCICDNKDGCNASTRLNSNFFQNYFKLILVFHCFSPIFKLV